MLRIQLPFAVKFRALKSPPEEGSTRDLERCLGVPPSLRSAGGRLGDWWIVWALAPRTGIVVGNDTWVVSYEHGYTKFALTKK